METLHESASDERQESAAIETNPVNVEERFARIVAAEVAGALKVNYGDRDIVVKLLTTDLERLFDRNSGGLLEQYLHTQLDRIADTFKRRFDLDEKIKPNYNYATHAKFENIIEAIKDKFYGDDSSAT
jgi:hypothetical protein